MANPKINLLIVDDNTEFCSLANTYLSESAEINVVGVSKDGKSALEFIKLNRPDIVLLDMIMPQLDGLGVLEALNTMDINPLPKIIMLSAVGHDKLTQKAISLGADYYVVKPFDFNVLIDRIKQMFQNEGHDNEVKAHIKPLEVNEIKSELSDLEAQITDLIHKVGIPAHISGYKYIREAISIYIDQKGMIAITKELYPQIAEKYNTTSARVERAIRHAIEVACQRGKIDTLNKIASIKMGVEKTKPTNSEFIASLADMLRLKNRIS